MRYKFLCTFVICFLTIGCSASTDVRKTLGLHRVGPNPMAVSIYKSFDVPQENSLPSKLPSPASDNSYSLAYLNSAEYVRSIVMGLGANLHYTEDVQPSESESYLIKQIPTPIYNSSARDDLEKLRLKIIKDHERTKRLLSTSDAFSSHILHPEQNHRILPAASLYMQ